MSAAFVLTCWIGMAVLQSGVAENLPEPSYMKKVPGPNGKQSDIHVIIARRKQYESIRLAGVLALSGMQKTKDRSMELTSILEKREEDLRNLFTRIPYIVAYLVNQNPGVDIPMPKVSRMFLTTSVGKGEKEIQNVAFYLYAYFKMANSSRSEAEVNSLRLFATFQMKKLTRMIGNNYLGSTIVRINESVGFMITELNKVRDVLVKLPDLVDEVIKGPYDTISDDRIWEGYRLFNNTSV